MQEHEDITNAIIKGKKFLAAKKILRHIMNSWKNAKQIIEQELI